MVCGFLTVLPREIRDEIYAYILAPTGRIILDEDPHSKTARLSIFPRSPFETIRFDLLRTCRQIYEEARYIYWHGNVFCIEILHKKGADPVSLLDNQRHLATLIRRIEIRLWCAQNNELANAYSFILFLSSWARHGPLNEITFTVSGMGTMATFGQMVESRCGKKALTTRLDNTTTVTGVYLQQQSKKAASWGKLRLLLNSVGGSDFAEESVIGDAFVGVQRKMNIILGMKYTSVAAQKGWLDDHSPEDCEETLAEINRVLGGDLYVDGILCYKDQVQLRETFKTWRKDLEIQDMMSNI